MLKKNGLVIGLTLAAATFAITPSMADQSMPSSIKMVEAMNTQILADGHGMSLYTFDKDKMNVSNCNGDCAVKWPPLMAKSDAKGMGDYSVIKRADGSMQWANKGMPLYTWFKDKKQGDTTGDGVKGVWHIAKP